MEQNKDFIMTPQRQVILEELCKFNSHPSADELYEAVRKRLPRISLGTVYRNLEILSEKNIIHKIEFAGTQKKFDGNIQNHYHIRCINCGLIVDAPVEPDNSIHEKLQHLTDFEINGHHLEFIGLCPECKSKPDKAV